MLTKRLLQSEGVKEPKGAIKKSGDSLLKKLKERAEGLGEEKVGKNRGSLRREGSSSSRKGSIELSTFLKEKGKARSGRGTEGST